MRSLVASLLGQEPTGKPEPVSGGCIHQSVRWGSHFIKSNTADHLPGFEAEATGLQAIAAAGCIRVPEVIAVGASDGTAVLILEHLDLQSTGNEVLLGESLAMLHRPTNEPFGFPSDNFIGSTPQPNRQMNDWAEFFAEQRLSPLFRRLQERGVNFADADRLLNKLDALLPKSPSSSLLHGDLWGGNRGFLTHGTPVLFDPACYHGHAACELAMTRLFGGFGEAFYEAYESNVPRNFLAPELHEIYNLYHVLNHALLFGGGYVEQARAIIDRHV